MENSINNSYIKIKNESDIDSDTESIEIIRDSYDDRSGSKILNSRFENSEIFYDSIHRDKESIESSLTTTNNNQFMNSEDNKMNDNEKLKHGLTEIFEEVKLSNENNLHENLLENIANNGITGLNEYKDDIKPKIFSVLYSKVESLLKPNCSFEAFSSYFKRLMITFKILDEDDLHSNITDSMIENLLVTIEQFSREIETAKFNKLKGVIESRDEQSKTSDVDFQSYIKSLLKYLNIENDRLKIKISECFLKVFEKFRNDIAPKIFKKITDSMQPHLELSQIKIETEFDQNLKTIDMSQIQINDTCVLDSKKMNLTEERLKSIPDCLERNILNLIFLINSSNHFNEKINDELNLAKKRLIIEKFDNPDLDVSLELIGNKIMMKDWKSADKELVEFSRKIKPVDIFELKFLIKKAREAGELIKNQDVILFFGKTGSGKSTTIQFLAGSKMIKKKVEIEDGKYLEIICPDENLLNPAFKSVVVGFQNSETRYINPVTVNLIDLGAFEDKTIILCDAPGFGDTAGPEVDIANGVGIIDAIKGCRSVKPVILSSYKSLGDRGEGIRELAHILVNMVANIKDHLGSFSYIFTKYPSDICIHTTLLNIKKSIDKSPDENPDESFNKLLINILEKTNPKKTKTKSLDPVNQEPFPILNSLIETEAIHDPSQVFRFTMTEKSRSALNEQINMHQESIRQALKRDEYQLINYKLIEIQFLSDNLKEDSITQKFKESIMIISNYINEKYNQILSSLNANLDYQNKISIEDVEQYQIQMRKFKELECFKCFDSLASVSGLSQAFIQNLKIKFDELFNKSKEMNMISIDLKITLDNMKLLMNKFHELQPKYIEVCNYFYKKLENFEQDIKENLKSNELNKTIELIQIIHKSEEILEDHLDIDKIKKFYFNSIEAIIKHLKQECSSIDDTLKKEYVTENDLKFINLKCEILENAKDSVGLRSFISKEDLNEIYSNFVGKLVKYFEKLSKKIEQFFKQNSFKEMEEIIKQMRNIRLIPIIELKSSEIFHSTIQKIVCSMQNLSNETEQLLDNLKKGNENVDYLRIFSNLSILKDAEWINNHKKGTYEYIIKNIKDHLIKHSFNLKDKLMDLDLTNSDNLEAASKLFQQFNTMRDFEIIGPEIKQNIETSINQFKNSLESILNYIKDTFNTENSIPNRLEIKLKDLNNIKVQYNSLHPSFIYLKDQNYESIDDLNEEINNSESSIEENKNEEAKLISILNEKQNKFINSKSAVDKNLFEEFQELKEEIKNLDNEKNKELIKLDELKQIKIKFNDLSSGKSQESKEAKQFILSTSFKNIQSLDQEIENTQTEITNTKQLGQQFVFNRLEAKTADSSLKYLDACNKHIKIYKVASLAIRNDLENYIRLYKEQIETEIDDFFKKIISIRTDSNLAFGYAQRLKNRLNECNEIEKLPLLDSLVDSKKIISELVNKLDQNFLELNDHLDRNKDNINELKNKIDIVKALSQLDNYTSRKYFKLFQDYQLAINKEFKEFYIKIIGHIEKNEYMEVANQLLQIEDSPINENAFNRIKVSLSSSLHELIGKTTTKSIMISNTLETKDIHDIVVELRKLEIAKKYISGNFDQYAQEKFKTKSYLDDDTQDRLEKSIFEIQSIISSKILTYLGSIEASIAINGFNEAEDKTAHLNSIRTLLGNYCNTVEIQEKFQFIQKKLDGIVEQVLNEYKNMPFNQYCLNPPRTIIESLQSVAKRNIQYGNSLRILKEDIMSNIRKKLKEAIEAKPEQREDLLQLIQSALCSLPNEMKGFLEVEVQNVKQTIKSKELGYESEYKRIITSDDVKSIYNFMEKCSNNGMNTFLRLVQDEILKLGITCKEDLIKYLEEDNVKGALKKFEKFFEYKKMFGNRMIEIESCFNEIEKHLINKFNRISSALVEIGITEDNDLILKKFEDFNNFMELKYKIEIDISKNEHSSEMVKKIGSQLETTYKKISEFFLNYQSKYLKSMDEHDIPKINETMNIMKKFDPLLIKVKKFSRAHSMDNLLKIDECKSYKEKSDFTSINLNNLKDEILSFDLLVGFEEERDLFYKQFTKKLQFLMQSYDLKDHINNDVFNVNCFDKEIFPFLENKFHSAATEAKKIFDIAYFSKKDFDDFRLNYDNLITFDKYSRIKGLNLAKLIGEINVNINKRLDSLQKVVYETAISIENVANSLINLKLLADNLPVLNEVINQRIDKMLKDFSSNSKVKEERGIALAKLSSCLEQDSSGIGLIIISEHKIFKGQAISMFNQEIQRHDMTYVIQKLDGDLMDFEGLNDFYEKFDNIYKTLVKDNLKRLERKNNKDEILSDLIRAIKLLPANLIKKTNYNVWNANDKRTLVNLISHIFALWTLQNTEYFSEMKGIDNVKKDSYLLTPHPGQVVSIFRILGIGYFEIKQIKNSIFDIVKKMTFETVEMVTEKNDGLKNNLVQVGTGEGKSLILAVTACILSLIGFEVSCACYSDYLSSRDFDSFLPIFNSLDIASKIHYGTFNKICENIINEQGDIRVRVVDLISKNKTKIDTDTFEKINTPKILLVDEVDVFFNEDFYGNIYTPLARLKDPNVNKLTDYIWRNRNSRLNIKNIESTVEYKALCTKFKGWESLIKESTKDMLVDVLEYKHDYIVKNDKLAYKEQDGISFDVVYGYKTLFAYYFENEQGQISNESLNENISIGIKCGSFSYAEIPYRFEFIMGVTGTLKTLSKPEWSIVKEIYKIKYSTFMPSVFGENKRQFAKEADVFIENKDDYFIRLKEKIDYALTSSNKKTRRAVLVFFDSKKSLLEFYSSKNAQEIRSDIQIITEEVSSSPKEKDMLIKRATTSGQITLLTRVFGRGTDFVCRDHNVIANGGVHVIQAFYSDELSEEIQIMGRTARQGKDGSFGMVLLDSELEKYLGVTYREKIDEMRKNKNTYDTLNEERNKLFEMKFVDINESVRAAKSEHLNGQKFIENLNKNEIEWIKNFLSERNIGANGLNDSRTICLMDATGSMGHLLNQAKNTVGTMFERATIILKDHGIPTDSFQMQFAVYRDYDCLIDGLLQYSPWETKPENLRKFMETITARGGGDYEEAIEIGLWHANTENEKNEISQVILIGDAPSKSKAQILDYRKSFLGLDYWKKSKFKEITHYTDEMNKLKTNNIPIHAFYLHNGAKTNFEEMAKETGGQCKFLDINSADSSSILTDIVTEQILSSVGQNSGKSEELVAAYKAKFAKTYK